MRVMFRVGLILWVSFCSGMVSRVAMASADGSAAVPALRGDASRSPGERPASGAVLESLAAKWTVTDVPRFVGDTFPESNEMIADIGGYAQSQFLTSFVVKTFTAARESASIMAGAGFLVFTGVCWAFYRRACRPRSFGIYEAADEEVGCAVPSRRIRRLPGRHLKNGKCRDSSQPAFVRVASPDDVTTDRPLRVVRVLRSRGLLKRRVGDASS